MANLRIEEQVLENTSAIQDISDNAQKINELPGKTAPIVDVDLIPLYVSSTGETIQITKAELTAAITFQADTNNYASLAPPQLFNPDATAVSTGTDDYTLINSNDIGFITVNGQVIDDSEYSLSGAVLTVTPDNGFADITDEVLVFQHTFTTVGTGGVIGNYRYVDSVNTVMLVSDYIIDCNGTIEVDFLTSIGNSGKIVIIKNSGTGTVTIDGFSTQTIEGELTQTIVAGDSWTLVADGANWKLI